MRAGFVVVAMRGGSPMGVLSLAAPVHMLGTVYDNRDAAERNCEWANGVGRTVLELHPLERAEVLELHSIPPPEPWTGPPSSGIGGAHARQLYEQSAELDDGPEPTATERRQFFDQLRDGIPPDLRSPMMLADRCPNCGSSSRFVRRWSPPCANAWHE